MKRLPCSYPYLRRGPIRDNNHHDFRWRTRAGREAWNYSRPTKGLPVIGFSPNKPHQVSIRIEDANGNLANSQPIDFTAPGLAHPAEFPAIQVAR